MINTVKTDDPRHSILWRQLIDQSPWATGLTSELNDRYWAAYYPQFTFENCSFIVCEEATPLASVHWTKKFDQGKWVELSSFGQPTIYLENMSAPFSWLDRARSQVRVECEAILGDQSLRCVYENMDPSLDCFGRWLLEKNAKIQPMFTQVIDLNLDEAALFQQVRKSYRSLINWGKKNLKTELINKENVKVEVFDRFKALHAEVSGRSTRSDETWRLQYQMVKRGEAFAVLSYLEEKLVSAALFNVSGHHCLYASSASIRELFDKPLLHVGLWQAILYAKALGCKELETGRQHFGVEHSKKEMDIATFKRGFGGLTKCRLKLILNPEVKP